MDTPVVSVILPTYNRASQLLVSAGSVLAQTYRDLELIIVDDASQDDIEAAAAALGDSRVRYLRRETNGGPAAARNSGIAAARGRYIAFQDSDDEWMLDKLALQVDAVESLARDVLCVGALLREIDGRIISYSLPEAAEVSALGFANVASRALTYTQTWLIPKCVLEAAGGFDEELAAWEDWELFLRLADLIPVVSTPRSLVYSPRQDDSVTSDNSHFLGAMAQILDKHKNSLSAHPKQLAGLLYIRARRLIDRGRLKDARRDLWRAVKSDPAFARAWVYLFLTTFGRSSG